ncbi:MAG: ABC transporter, partial [Rhodoferax sp.]|nr:ABC transporter [Rhodoferax sp.]
MTNDSPATASVLLANEIPLVWRPEVQAQLHPGESVLAVLEVDLDTRLFFVDSLLLVTNQRLLSRAASSEWQSWPYHASQKLTHHDHAGVGHLSLLNDQGLLGSWRFTLGRNLQALRLQEQFQSQLQSHLTGLTPVVSAGHCCPSCKAPLEPDQDECPICTKVMHTPPSTWTLFRLWRFAKP